MATYYGVSSSEALRRGLNAGDETPSGIMALGAFIDTFVSGGGCSTAQPECRPFNRSRRECFPIKCHPQRTLSWDDSTLDTTEASEDSTKAGSSHHRAASPNSEKFPKAKAFKRRKSDEDLSQLDPNRVPSEDKSSCRNIGSFSESHSISESEHPHQEPKSMWSTDLLSNSFDQFQRSFSLEQAYGQSIFRDSTMESLENNSCVEGEEVPKPTTTTTTQPQPFRRQSTPSPLKAPYSSLADALHAPRSFRRQCTPRPAGKKPRLVSPDSTPKAHNSHRRASSSSPPRCRSLWSFRRSQSHQSPNKRRKPEVPKKDDDDDDDDDSSRTMPSRVRSSGTSTFGPHGNGGNCSSPKKQPTSFWSLEFPMFLCGAQGFEAEASFGKATKVNLPDTVITPTTTTTTTMSSSRDTDMEDLILEETPTLAEMSSCTTQTTVQPNTTLEGATTEPHLVKNPSHDSDILAKASFEQILDEASVEKKSNPLKSFFRTTTGILGKLSIEYQMEDPRAETRPISTTETHDADVMAPASVEDFRPDQSSDFPLDNNDNINHNMEMESQAVGVESTSVPPVNSDDRVGELEQQVHSLMDRIRQLEHEIKETGVRDDGQENDEDAELPDVVMNHPNEMEIEMDEVPFSHDQPTEDCPLEQGKVGNEIAPDEWLEQSKHLDVPAEEIPFVDDEDHAHAGATTDTNEEHMEMTNDLVNKDENQTDDDVMENHGIEVDFFDFVSTKDHVVENQDADNIVAKEQKLQQVADLDDEGIEISMTDVQNILTSNDTNKAVRGLERWIANNQPTGSDQIDSSSNGEVTEKKKAKKKGGIVRGLKKKLQRVAASRTSQSRIKSAVEAQEVMPMTGVYGVVHVGSEVSSVSSRVSSGEGRSTAKRSRGRFGWKERSCEVSLATGTTTLPTRNGIKSCKV